MKITAMLTVSSLLSALNPECGASVGSNVANGPSSASNNARSPAPTPTPTPTRQSPDTGTVTTHVDAGADPTGPMTCGALGTHAFCEDFDDGPLPGAFAVSATSAGTLSLDGTKSVSPPNSLLATTLHATTTTRTLARLSRAFTTNATRFTLAYAEWVDPACVGVSDRVDSSVIEMRSDTYSISMRHAATDALLEFSIGGGRLDIQSHDLRTQVPRGKWVHVAVDVDLAKSVLGLTVDGAKVVENEPLKSPPGAPQTPKISVGSLTDNISGPSACNINIDDVTFDMVP